MQFKTNQQNVRVTSQPSVNIRAFGHKLYSCQNGGTIQVFSHDLAPMHTWSNPEEWGDVNDVTELTDKQIAVAGSKGLFLISAGGQTTTILQSGVSCCSCVVIEDRLFACCKSQQRIAVYELIKNVWKEQYNIPRAMSSDSCLKLAAVSGAVNTIIYGYECSDPATICELSWAGLFMRKCVAKDDAGDYLLCDADAERSILVIDKGNDRLKVCDWSNGLTELNLWPPVRNPKSAVVIKNKLCVAVDDGRRLELYAPKDQ